MTAFKNFKMGTVTIPSNATKILLLIYRTHLPEFGLKMHRNRGFKLEQSIFIHCHVHKCMSVLLINLLIIGFIK